MSQISRSGCRFIALLLVLAAAVLSWAHRYGPAAQQARRFALAQAHATRLEPVLQHDSRFEDVRVGGWTGGGGRLWVLGRVTSAADSNALWQIVAESAPPVPVHFTVAVERIMMPARAQ